MDCQSDMTEEETLLVLRGLGVQTSTSSSTFLSTSKTTFIPTTKIQDIIIHEAFKGLEVRFYLAIIVEDATEVVVVFPVGTIIDCLEHNASTHPQYRNSCLRERSWKKSGVVQETAFTIARLER